jgi:hypothetical protein
MLREVRQALASVNELQPHIDAARAAGFDVDERQARVDAYRKMVAATLETYEPIVMAECKGQT